jgi:hypothetical protein
VRKNAGAFMPTIGVAMDISRWSNRTAIDQSSCSSAE